MRWMKGCGPAAWLSVRPIRRPGPERIPYSELKMPRSSPISCDLPAATYDLILIPDPWSLIPAKQFLIIQTPLFFS